MRSHHWPAALALVVVSILPNPVRPQGTGGPSSSDSRVGYIDSAIPGTLFRFRYDDTFHDVRPTRAEFFYPKGAPNGPGLPEPEPRVNFQELSAYLEFAPSERLSGFLELPVRFLHPEVNPNHTGFSDLNAGFKYAFLRDPDTVATFQFRVYAPTGDSHRGLGTDHVSLEPAFLIYHRLTDRLTTEAELRVWVPIDGTDFAGDIIRYGIGIHYDLCKIGSVQIAPITEVIGWTVLSGKTSVLPPDGVSFVEDAAGQTIVNVKLGARVQFGDHADIYTGYGRPLTGNRWYENTFRVELRVRF
jgi:hypothetical protein